MHTYLCRVNSDHNKVVTEKIVTEIMTSGEFSERKPIECKHFILKYVSIGSFIDLDFIRCCKETSRVPCSVGEGRI